MFTYTVEVEDGVDTTTFGGDDGFARMVSETLGNPKSWTHNPQFAFTRTTTVGGAARLPGVADVADDGARGLRLRHPARGVLLQPGLRPDDQPRVFINEARWVRGAVPFQGDIGSYRQYLINHEVGHAIGYQRHEPCGENGGLAPVMMQQTFSTSQQRRRPVRPGVGQARRQDVPVQPLAVPDRLSVPRGGCESSRELSSLIAVDSTCCDGQ